MQTNRLARSIAASGLILWLSGTGGLAAAVGEAEPTAEPAQALAIAPFLGAYLHLTRIVDARSERMAGERAIDQALDQMVRAGLNTVIPYATTSSTESVYPSQILPRTGPRDWDPLGYLVISARQRGLAVWPAVCVLAAGHFKPQGILLQHPEWALRDPEGKPLGFISPAHPEARAWIVSIAREIVEKYQPDGMLLDYLRYFNRPWQLDAAAQRQLDERLASVRVASPEARERLEQQLKEQQLTELARQISEAVRAVRPDLQIGVYSWGPHVARQHRVAQAWPSWVREGYVDMVNISGYYYREKNGPGYLDRLHTQLQESVQMVAATGRRVPLTFALGVRTSHGQIDTADEVQQYLATARRAGVDGVAIFTLSSVRPLLDELTTRRAFAVFDEAGTDPDGVQRTKTSRPNRLVLRKIAGNAAGQAVLGVGQPGRFDQHWVSCPTVVYDGELFQMWYSSLYDATMGRGGIGLATSRDGIDWERACGGRPVLSAGPDGALDDGQVMGPEVLFDGKQYRMWYTGMANVRHESGTGYYRVFLATSVDGVHWHRENEGRAVLDVGGTGSVDEVQAATPSILKDADGYRMWYAAWSPASNHRICSARSRDGVTWQRENDGQPVAGLSPSLAYGPAVCKLGKQYLMLYMALRAERTLYAATSDDGTHWKMLGGGQPVLPLGAGSEFDSDLIGHPFLLVTRDRLLVWYSGYRREPAGPRGWKLRIGRCDAQAPLP